VIRSAIGIAASTASGLRRNFGTMTKPLHAGMAARNAIVAVALARRGATADTSILDGPGGYLSLLGDAPSATAGIELLEGPPALAGSATSIKKYPSCFYTHAAIDALLAARRDLGTSWSTNEIAKIEVTVNPHGLDALAPGSPASGLAAKFSMEYCVLAALRHGSVSLRDFTDDQVRSAAESAQIELVSVRESSAPPFGPSVYADGYATVVLTSRDGRTARGRGELGGAQQTIAEDQLRAKFADCLTWGDPSADAESLFAWFRTIDKRGTVRWPESEVVGR
jgi:2-methylcitrate dehydratase PrpD